MDINDILKRYPALKTYSMPLVVALIGTISIGYGVFLAFENSAAENDEIVFHKETQDPKTSESQILVDIQGAVTRPGVYNISGSSRLNDVIVKAGGFSENADFTYIAKNINLAMKVKDGYKLYIRFAGEDNDSSETSLQSAEGNLININTASGSSLESLPGIGEVTADKIISSRPYESIEELVSRKIIGASVYEKIKDQISVY